jgi:hypothetical protein
MANTEKYKKNAIILANPNEKISFFKRLRMKLNIKIDNFNLFTRTNKYWKYYSTFIEDVFNYGLCGILISLPFFTLSPLTIGLSVGGAIFLYSNKLHTLLLQVLSSIRIISIDKGTR